MMRRMRSDDLGPDLAFETLAVHAGAEPDTETGAVAPPIYQTSTYAQDGVNRPRGGYDYARTANPTRDRLQRAVAALEGGGEGIAFASGSAATAAIAELAAPGSEIVVGDDVYGGTFRYLEKVRRPNGVDARYVNLADNPDALWEAMTEKTRLVWFETPTNPLLKVIDIGAAGRTIGDRFPDRPGRPLLVVDNTFASPALQRPLDQGADIVFHSATKYLAGHSDTVLGVAVTRDPESPSDSASCRTRWAVCPARSTASWCCAAFGRSTSASSVMPRTRLRSRRSSRRAVTLPGSPTRASCPGPTSIRRPRSLQARCEPAAA